MLPKELRIVGKRYKIVIRDEMQDNRGMCDDMRQELYVLRGQPHDLECDTILHEAIHALDYHMQLRLTEEQVTGLGAAVYALLSDNPSLLDHIANRPNGEADDARQEAPRTNRARKRRVPAPPQAVPGAAKKNPSAR